MKALFVDYSQMGALLRIDKMVAARKHLALIYPNEKADFVKMDLPTLAKDRVDSMVKNLTNGTASDAKEVTVAGKKGLQFEIRGEIDNLRIGYLYTILESDENFYRVLGWTTLSKFTSTVPKFQEMLQSFNGK